MASLNCKEVRVLLSPYIDGAVTPFEKEAINDHISKCEFCHSALFNLLKVSDMVKQEYNNSHNIRHKDLSKNIMARVHCNAQALSAKNNIKKKPLHVANFLKRNYITAAAIFLVSLISVLSADITPFSKPANSISLSKDSISTPSNSIKELEADPLAKFILDHYSASYNENILYSTLNDEDEVPEVTPFNNSIRGVTTVNFKK